MADPVGGKTQIGLAGRIFGIAVFVLEIRAGGAQGGFKLRFQLADTLVVTRHTFGAGEEYIGDVFITVHV